MRPLIPLLLGLALLGCPAPKKTAQKTTPAKSAQKTVAAAKTASKTGAPAKTPDVATKLPRATYFAFKG